MQKLVAWPVNLISESCFLRFPEITYQCTTMTSRRSMETHWFGQANISPSHHPSSHSPCPSPSPLSSHLPLNPSLSPPAKPCFSASSPKCNVHLPSSFPFYNCILPLSYCPTPPYSFSFSHYSHFPFSPLILPTYKWYLSFSIHHFALSPSKAASSFWKHSLPILPPPCKILPDFFSLPFF